MSHVDIVNYEEGVTRLYRCIEKEKWEEAKRRCRERPEEARVWIYRKNPDGNTIRWCVLPIHQACARHCPEGVMHSLLVAYPNGVRKKSYQMASEKTAPRSLRDIDYNDGNLPIHFACEWGVPVKVIEMLIGAFPESVRIQDRRGLNPMTIAIRAKYEHKDRIVAVIDNAEHELKMRNLESQVNTLAGEFGKEVEYDYADELESPVRKMATSPPQTPQSQQQHLPSPSGKNRKSDGDLHAKVFMLESENAALKETVNDLTVKVSYLSNTLEAMITAQKTIVKMTGQQERAMQDAINSLKNG
mmetsp:Transcript_12617/g.15895  ORF Transcript_12617/g.15895 Transcript_12617/m.15895 type:complete len:301 (+) Transcript_12617:117-1019(+)